MSGGVFGNALTFLVGTVFRFFIGAVMLRFLLQRVHADFRFNPLSRALVTLTNPVLRPLRRMIPGYAGIDWAAIVLMSVLAAVEVSLLLLLGGTAPSLPALLVLALAELLWLLVTLYFYAILVMVLLSWFAPDAYNPGTELLDRLTWPLLEPARRLPFAVIGSLDLSPLVIAVLLQLTMIVIIEPLNGYGFRLL